jgi:hypothetical protein
MTTKVEEERVFRVRNRVFQLLTLLYAVTLAWRRRRRIVIEIYDDDGGGVTTIESLDL